MQRKPNNVSIYACGGAGINIVGSLEVVASDAIASASSYAIDTSLSNLAGSKFDTDHTFLVEGDGIDGSGQERAENHPIITRNTPAMLQRFKPGVFNILVHSGGGGSGSIIAGSIANELLKANEQFVVIVIGSKNTLKELSNTEKTLKSYDNLARTHSRPIAVCYLENSADAGRLTINGAAHASLHALLMLFSGLNRELDTADLRNWIKNAGASEIFALHFCPTLEAYQQAGNVISVATLARDDHNPALVPAPAYQTVGLVNSDAGRQAVTTPLHFTLSSNLIESAARSLRSQGADDAKRLGAIAKRDSLITGSDHVTDNGLVL